MGNTNQRSHVTDLGKTICALAEAISIKLLQPNSFMNKTAAYKLTGCLQLSLPPGASHAPRCRGIFTGQLNFNWYLNPVDVVPDALTAKLT